MKLATNLYSLHICVVTASFRPFPLMNMHHLNLFCVLICVFQHSHGPPHSCTEDTVQELYDYVILLQVSKYTQTAQLYQHRQTSDLKWHFVIDRVKSAYTNTVDVELKTQLPCCYLCRSLDAIFSCSQEEVSLCSRLKKGEWKESNYYVPATIALTFPPSPPAG